MKIIKQRWEKYYHAQNKHRYLHLLVDLSLVAVVLILIGVNVYFSAFKSSSVLGTHDTETATTTPDGETATTTDNNNGGPSAPINLSLRLSSDQEIVAPGETVSYSVSYKNDSQFDLKDVAIFLTADMAVTENSRQKIVIEKIPAGESGDASFEIKIRTSMVSVQAGEFIIKPSAIATFIDPQAPDREISTDASGLTQKITTPIVLNAFARYYAAEGDQIGIGPLPPKVGETTKYWIFLSIDNYYNNLKNISVTARLADNVSLTGRQSATAGQIIANTKKEIIWTLDEAAVAAAGETNSLGVALEVAFTPTADQVGAAAILADSISLAATDDFTGQTIAARADNITTNLTFDKLENSGGIVQ